MEIKVPIVIDDEVIQKAAENVVSEIKKNGDFVIVTRCKDCKYYDNAFCCSNQWFHTNCVTIVQENDFCSYAEPKEIEGERE